MATTIGKLAASLSLNAAGFVAGLSTAQRSVTGFAGAVTNRFTAIGTGVAALAGTATMGYLLKSSAENVRSLNNLADRLGLVDEQMNAVSASARKAASDIVGVAQSAKEASNVPVGAMPIGGNRLNALRGLQYAAAQADVPVETLNSGLEKMNLTLAKAAAGNKGALDTFAQLGLSVDALSAMPADQRFLAITDAINQFGSAADRAYLTTEIFGRGSGRLVQVMNQGSDAIRRTAEAGVALSGSLSSIDAARIGQADNAFKNLKTSITSVAERIAVSVAPYVTNAANVMTRAFVWVRDTALPVIADFVNKAVQWFIDLSVQIAPLALSVYGSIKAAFSFLTDVVSGAFSNILSALNAIASGWGGFMGFLTEFKNAFVDTFIIAEFAFTRWKDIIAYGMLWVGYEVTKLGGLFVYWFSDVVPWLFRNALDIFGAFQRGTAQVFMNIAENIATIFKNLPAIIQGSVSVGDLWKPLTDGFVEAFKNLEPLPARQIGEMENTLRKSVESMGGTLKEDFGEFLARRRAEIASQTGRFADWLKNLFKPGALPGDEAPAFGTDQVAPDAVKAAKVGMQQEGLRPAALAYGSREAYSASLGRDDATQTIAQNTARSNQLLTTATTTLDRISRQLDDDSEDFEVVGIT